MHFFRLLVHVAPNLSKRNIFLSNLSVELYRHIPRVTEEGILLSSASVRPVYEQRERRRDGSLDEIPPDAA